MSDTITNLPQETRSLPAALRRISSLNGKVMISKEMIDILILQDGFTVKTVVPRKIAQDVYYLNHPHGHKKYKFATKAEKQYIDTLLEGLKQGTHEQKLEHTETFNKAQQGEIIKGPDHAHGGVNVEVNNKPVIEAEGNEIIINADASAKHCEQLSEINQSTGGKKLDCDSLKNQAAKGAIIDKKDRAGNEIGDGTHHSYYRVSEFNEYPEIKSSVSESATTESVYVTYTNTKNGETVTVRFSDHENNATKFGDQLNGNSYSDNEILHRLGLKQRVFIPDTYLMIDSRQVAMKKLDQFEEAPLTIKEMYDLGKDADISQHKGKLAKGSNYLILGDKVTEQINTGRDYFGNPVQRGKYIYKDIENIAEKGTILPTAGCGCKLAADGAIVENETAIPINELTDAQIMEIYPKLSKTQLIHNSAQVETILSQSEFSAKDKYMLELYEGLGSQTQTGIIDKGLLHQFYTPYILAKKVFDLANKYGFTGGNILETSMGTGRFFKFAPANSKLFGFDPDKKNFEIVKILYPSAETYNEAFETAFLEKPRLNKMAKQTWLPPIDLVAGNPPYGEYMGYYKSFMPTIFKRFEFLFIYLGLKTLKKDGLLIFVISQNFMNNGAMYNGMKEKILELGTFVDAIRLPNGIFSSTEVGTDIVIFRKK